MRRYSILHPLWMAFYSGDIYDDVARNWRIQPFLYLIILLAIGWLPRYTQLQNAVDDWMTQEAPSIIDQIPAITISEGQLSTSVNTPVLVHDQAGQVFLIIDATGEYTSLDGTNASLLLTKTDIHIRDAASNVQTQPLPAGPPETLTQETLYEIADFIRSLINTLLFPILIIISYIFRIGQVLIYALLGRHYLTALRKELPYRTLVHLAIIAVTPSVLLDGLHDLMETPFPTWFWWPACFLLSTGYLVFGIRIVTGTEEEQNSIQS
jgi:hypothetical protein